MQAKTLNPSPRVYALIFDTGEEAVAGIQDFAADNQLTASQVSAIGAVQAATLGYFDWEQKNYRYIEVPEQLEVLSLNGDIALNQGKPMLHAHAVFGRSDGSTCGGHLMRVTVRPTLEVILMETPGYLLRELDAQTGLPLIRVRQ